DAEPGFVGGAAPHAVRTGQCDPAIDRRLSRPRLHRRAHRGLSQSAAAMVGDMTLPPLAAIPGDLQSLPDYERRAVDHLPPATWPHPQGGAEAELSLAANREQFEDLRLIPRQLAVMRGASTGLELFGLRHAAPILLAPLAYHRLAHPQGELATISAATALDTTMAVSTLSSIPLEDVPQVA